MVGLRHRLRIGGHREGREATHGTDRLGRLFGRILRSVLVLFAAGSGLVTGEGTGLSGPGRRAAAATAVLQVEGLSAGDAGAIQSPPVVSRADCCSQLSYPSPTTKLRVVAGLRYQLAIHSAAGALGIDPTAARLRLLRGGAPLVDTNCSDPALIVTNFGGATSSLDGKTSADIALATVNVWAGARVPFNGTFGLCYASNGGRPSWRALVNSTLNAYGAPEPSPPSFWCAAEAEVPCAIRVASSDPTARVRLVEVGMECGTALGALVEPLFQRTLSLPVLSNNGFADHSLGGYVGNASVAASFRVCFCQGFEYDVTDDGYGSCRSFNSSDFPQTLGYLHLMTASSEPEAVYPGRPFQLSIRCGDPALGGGCSGLDTVRVKLTESAGSAVDCGATREAAFYRAPANCNWSIFNCSFKPSVRSTFEPKWNYVTVRSAVFQESVLPYKMGVCYCNGPTCALATDWLYTGGLLVDSFVLHPNPLQVGRMDDLSLASPGSGTLPGAPRAPELKLLLSTANSSFDTTDVNACWRTPQLQGTIWGHACSSQSDCTEPTLLSDEDITWSDITFLRAGLYAVCYCDSGCGDGARWDFIGWELAAGPLNAFIGTPQRGSRIFAGNRFELTVVGAGLSASDRLTFLPEGSSCLEPTGFRAQPVDFEVQEPVLAGSTTMGEITAIRASPDGVVLVTAQDHGLLLGDFVNISNLTVRDDAVKVCPRLFSVALQRTLSRCTEVLNAQSLEVLKIPSSTSAVLAAQLSADECAALDLTSAEWAVSSRETFVGRADRTIPGGSYTICWGSEPHTDADYTGQAGVLVVLAATQFLSSIHLTSLAPGVDTFGILAFETGNDARYSRAVGPLSFRIVFRDRGRLGHAFRAGIAGAALSVPRAEASQVHCGRLFRELWADSEDGFPQPQGCFYDEAQNEYGILFPARAGLKPGTRYQAVLPIRVTSDLVKEHDWRTLYNVVPVPEFQPWEVTHTRPDTGGDIGVVANAEACKEECSALKSCNVAVYHANTDLHCLLADVSRRDAPFATKDANATGRSDITMFIVDRLNTSRADLQYNGPVRGTPDVVADLWSMDDMYSDPFGVIEASEVTVSASAGLPAMSSDPRWHVDGGLKVMGSDVEGGALQLDTSAPSLSLRIRAAPGGPIKAGSIIHLFLFPLTLWSLPRGCDLRCQPDSTAGPCGRVQCSPLAVVTAPWAGSRNVLRMVLPRHMDTVTESVMHTLTVSSPSLVLPPQGFLPSRLAADLSPPGSEDDSQPRVDYAVSQGALPYVPVVLAGALLARDGNERPFASDQENVLYLLLRFGATLQAGPTAQATFTLQLPVGYSCNNAQPAPANLTTLLLAAQGGPQAGGTLPPEGTWSFQATECTYRLPANAAIYGMSSIIVALTVDNPPLPMPTDCQSNIWTAVIVAPGDAAAPLTLPATPLVGPSAGGEDLFMGSAAVLGRLTYVSLVPMDFWWAAPRNFLRVFFRPAQSTEPEPGLFRLTAPEGFILFEHCSINDLPDEYYREKQGIYAGDSLRTVPLPSGHQCRAFTLPPHHPPTWQAGLKAAQVELDGPLYNEFVYGFTIEVLHPSMYDRLGRSHFWLATFAGSLRRPLDLAVMPLVQATAADDNPSYGIYRLRANASVLKVILGSMLPFAYTGVPTTVTVLLRAPLNNNATDPEEKAWSTQVPWRVFAPATYEWAFSRASFFYRQVDVPGATADLPVRQPPYPPLIPPLNRLDFEASNEYPPGWQLGQICGFRVQLRVPPETPRHSANEWIAEWGFTGQYLSNRSVAAKADGGSIRTLHSFSVRSLVSMIEGQANDLLFLLGTVTPVPPTVGALVIEAPVDFVFEVACSPFNAAFQYKPYMPVPVRLSCTAQETVVLAAGGVLRPRVLLRPLDEALPSGMWSFVLTCTNPASATSAATNINTFILHSYVSYTDDANAEGTNTLADVSATTAGFQVCEEMPFAGIVGGINYLPAGRNDQPGQASNVILAFELRGSLAAQGNEVLQVIAPAGYYFQPACKMAIGKGIFGAGVAYPAPYVAFEDGVELLSCRGSFNMASMEVTPGLRRGRRYAFRLHVDLHPTATPASNGWQIACSGEAAANVQGYPLWAMQNIVLSMLRTNLLNPAVPVENLVELGFTPTNTFGIKGALLVVAPAGFEVRTDCRVEVWQVADDAATTADVGVPASACQGEQPPANRAQIRFLSDLAVLAGGVRYRVVLTVWNPTVLPASPGYWTLESYSALPAGASDGWIEPEHSALLDSGQVVSFWLYNYFSVLDVRLAGSPSPADLELALEFSLSLPEPITGSHIMLIAGPSGYDFAIPVADPSLQGDFRQCSTFEDVGTVALPVPLCAGSQIEFAFSGLTRNASGLFRFRIVTDWPRDMLAPSQSFFTAALTDATSGATKATGVVFLAPVVPRLRAFSFSRVGDRADAVRSVGHVEIAFVPSQSAQALTIVAGLYGHRAASANFSNATVQVDIGSQVLKEVQVVGAEALLVLAFQIDEGVQYTVLLSDVQNPAIVGKVLWTLQTFARPKVTSTLVTANTKATATGDVASEGVVPPHLAPTTQILSWLQADNLRDEMVDWIGWPTVGRLSLGAGSPQIESGFFDFTDTTISFTISVSPGDAAAGSRLLIFAPQDWTFLPSTFLGAGKFPAFVDVGVRRCFDPAQLREAAIYIVRLLEPLPAALPCEVNPSTLCVNLVPFSIHVSTPTTPIDLSRWRREADQSWLLQIDRNINDTCGNASGDQLDRALLAFSSDAQFKGFDLKESMGRVAVFPEPGGQRSRQHVTMAVEFTISSSLRTDGKGIFLRASAPRGFEFDRGCLAAMPDPDYLTCEGMLALAVVRVRGNVLEAGEHRLALAAQNPPWTPSPNWWILESFEGVDIGVARAGLFSDVRQRGRVEGYEIVQNLAVTIRPSTSDIGTNTLLFISIEPDVYVGSLGYLELHAAQGFQIACLPDLVYITMPLCSCRSFQATSATEIEDPHDVVQLRLGASAFLLPNYEYEFGVHARNPDAWALATVTSRGRWGIRLLTALREVLQANLAVKPYNLTNWGMAVVSLVPGSAAPYSQNEIRMILSFSRTLPAGAVSDIRITAPAGWDFRPLCNRFADTTGGCTKRCPSQLPLSEARGHHACPRADLLFMLVDLSKPIQRGAYTLLFGAKNPAASPPRNWWTVALLTAATNAGWTRAGSQNTTGSGLKPGQAELVVISTLGFDVGDRLGPGVGPSTPLEGQVGELLGAAAPPPRGLGGLALALPYAAAAAAAVARSGR